MPNWCHDCVVLHGDNDSIGKVEALLLDLQDNGREDNSNFGKLWLGNVVEKLGLDWREVSCRGWIEDFEREGDRITLFASTAWSDTPIYETFNALASHEDFPGVEFCYVAEEPGCGYFINTDTTGEYFKERWYVDYETAEDGCHTDWLDSEDELLSFVKETFGVEYHDADEVMDKAGELADADKRQCLYVGEYTDRDGQSLPRGRNEHGGEVR